MSGVSAGEAEPSVSAFDLMGGEPGVRALCERFYALMALEPSFAQLRSLHPDDLSGSTDKLFWFLCGWLGGPQHYIERFGHPRLRARHLPFSIGIKERDQWMQCMVQSMAELGLPPELAQRLETAFASTADWMRNRGA